MTTMTVMQVDADEVLAAWADDLRGFIAGMGVALDAVDDLAQEAFLSYLRQPERRPSEVEEIRWLKGIARNLAYDWFRRHARGGRLELAELLAYAAVPQPAPTEARLAALRHCLASIDAAGRDLLDAAYLQHDTSEAIAKRLGRSPSGVRMALLRLRERLRQCVDERLAREEEA